MDVNTIASRGGAAVHASSAPPARPTDRRADSPGERPGAGAAAADLKFTLRSADAEAKYAIHEATNTVMVTIIDRRTGEVIREIPSRPHLDLVAALQGKGNLIDTAQ